jgi:ABC-type Mn2+/Zn2+ transport system ATPase subunit
MVVFKVKEPFFLPHIACQVELKLSPGEGIIITGENGIGKSSLLKHLLHFPYELSYVGQKTLDIFYDRTVDAFLEILFTSRSQLINQEDFNLFFNGFGLSRIINRRMSNLSGGEMQALKLAIGLSKNAAIFLIDEPLQSLDLNRQKFLIDSIEKMKASGKSFILVEHNLEIFSPGWSVYPLIIKEAELVRGEMWTI